MNILLVEDDEVMAEVLVHGLQDESYEVDRATDGRAALQLTGDTAFDLILLDVMLPGMNGLEVARQLRSERQFRSGPDAHGARRSSGYRLRARCWRG